MRNSIIALFKKNIIRVIKLGAMRRAECTASMGEVKN
jgi:hypothetical protein